MSDEIKNGENSTEVAEVKAEKAAKVKSDKADKNKTEKQKKQSKGNIFVRIGKSIARFFKNTKGEIKKIIWPGRQMVLKSTGVVIASILIIGAGVWIVDYAISGGLGLVNDAADKMNSASTTVVETTSASDTSDTTSVTGTETTTEATEATTAE